MPKKVSATYNCIYTYLNLKKQNLRSFKWLFSKALNKTNPTTYCLALYCCSYFSHPTYLLIKLAFFVPIFGYF
jgi:hypothetical protein